MEEQRLLALHRRRARIDQLRARAHHAAPNTTSPHLSPSPSSGGGGGGRLTEGGSSSSSGMRSWSDPSRTGGGGSSCHMTRAGSSMSHLDLPGGYPLPHHHYRFRNCRQVPAAAGRSAGAECGGGGSPRNGSMSPMRQKQRGSGRAGGDGGGELSIVEQRPPSGRPLAAAAASRDHRRPLADYVNNNNKCGGGGGEMMEKASSFTHTLDLIDGDCVRDDGDYFGGGGGMASSSSRPLSQSVRASRFGRGTSGGGGGDPSSNKQSPGVRTAAAARLRRRNNFFENEDDSPLLVSSIDGVSTQVIGRCGGSGPSSLDDDEDEGEGGGGGLLLLRSGSQFSLLTPAASPFAQAKSRGDPRRLADGGGGVNRLGSVSNLATAATPYSSIRKRLKSVVSMKYLKMMPKLNGSSSGSSQARPSYPGSLADSTISSLGMPSDFAVHFAAETHRKYCKGGGGGGGLTQ
jgi:hypothetical protein